MKKLLIILSLIIGLVILGVSLKAEACWNCCKPRPTPTEEPTPTPEPTPTQTPKPTPTESPKPSPKPSNGGDSTCHTCPKTAPTCQDKVPGKVPNAFAVNFNYGDYCQPLRWWPSEGANKAHVMYKEHGATSWQHALLNTDNDGSEDICLLKDGVAYDFTIAGVSGCAVGQWSDIFSNSEFYP